MIWVDKRATCLSILMAAVNWDCTEKVIDTRTVTVSLCHVVTVSLCHVVTVSL